MNDQMFNNHITKEDKRKFKGIWINDYIWFYSGLNVMEKAIYLEIDSLDNDQGCYASNDHFSKFSGLSKTRCSEIIKSLESKGLIFIKYTYKIKNGVQTKEVDKRIIRVNPDWERSVRDEYEKQCDEIAEEKRMARKASDPPMDNAASTPFGKSNTPFGKPKAPFGKPKDKEYSLNEYNLNNHSLVTRGESETTPPEISNKNIEHIQEKTALKLTPAQCREVSKWTKDKIETAISLFIVCGGHYYSFLRKCYYTPFDAVANPKKKNSFSESMYKHDWDLEELEKQAMNYMASTLKEETLLDW